MHSDRIIVSKWGGGKTIIQDLCSSLLLYFVLSVISCILPPGEQLEAWSARLLPAHTHCPTSDSLRPVSVSWHQPCSGLDCGQPGDSPQHWYSWPHSCDCPGWAGTLCGPGSPPPGVQCWWELPGAGGDSVVCQRAPATAPASRGQPPAVSSSSSCRVNMWCQDWHCPSHDEMRMILVYQHLSQSPPPVI